MPINYRNYIFDWKSRVRPDIMKRANNHCEDCGVRNYTVVQVFRSGLRVNQDTYFTYKDASSVSKKLNLDANTDLYKYVVVVLTIAHLDHDIKNNEYSNLKALCQKCHNRHDIKDRVKNRKSKTDAK